MKLNRYALCFLLGLGLFACKKKDIPAETPTNPTTGASSPGSDNKTPGPSPESPTTPTPVVSAEEPDMMVMLNFGALYDRFQAPLKSLTKDMIAKQSKESEKQALTFAAEQGFDLLSKLRQTKVQMKVFEKEVELSLNVKLRNTTAKWDIRDPMLAQYLPADDLVRFQGAFPSGLGLDTLVNQIIPMIPPQDQQSAQMALPMIQKGIKTIEGMQVACSFKAIPNAKEPRVLGITTFKDINQFTALADEMMVKMGQGMKADTTSIHLGKEDKEYRHMAAPTDPKTGQPKAEFAVFNNYLLTQINGTTQELKDLAMAIESGKGQPLKAMKIFGKEGSFYLDVNYKKAVELKNAEDPSPEMSMLAPMMKDISTEDGIISAYINSNYADGWLKVKVPNAAFKLMYDGYQVSQLMQQQRREMPAPTMPPEAPAPTEQPSVPEGEAPAQPVPAQPAPEQPAPAVE